MDSYASTLLAQFLVIQPEPVPEIKPLPTLPPEVVREQLHPETEHQCEAI